MSLRVAFLPKLQAKSPRNPCNKQKMYGSKCWSSRPDWWKMAMFHHQEWLVTASFIFSSLKMGKLSFTQRPLPKYADPWLLPDVLITAECATLWSFPLSELPHPWRGWASERTSRNHWYYLLLVSSIISNWASSAGITGFSHLPFGCSLIRPLIQSSALQVSAESLTALPNFQGHPGVPGLNFLPHDSIHNSSTAFLHHIGNHF